MVDRGWKSVEKGMSFRVDSGVGSRDAAVGEQCLRIANVAGVGDQSLAGQEEDDASSKDRRISFTFCTNGPFKHAGAKVK